MSAKTIDDVLRALDDIIESARNDRSRLGYFPALYRGVTAAVKDGIASGRFDDGPRMERFDVIFANRYLQAMEQFRKGEQCTECWMTAFQSAKSWRPLVIQHLLLGMNAHINLDLGIAAAQTMSGGSLSDIKNDFEKINDVLFELVDEVQDKIAIVSPWMRVLDKIGGRTDEAIAEFSMGKAREAAWSFAQRIAAATPEDMADAIDAHDKIIGALARKVRNPGYIVNLGILLIRFRESDDVPRVIDVLS